MAPALQFRTWPVVAVALGGLLLLIILSTAAIRQKIQQVYTQLDEVNARHRNLEIKLRRLRSDVNLSGILVRDYLLDPSYLTGPAYRSQLVDLREATTTTVRELEDFVDPRDAGKIGKLRAELEEYWQVFDPLFDWTPQQKSALSTVFLRRQILPRRNAILSITQDIEQFNNANLAEQQAQVAVRQRDLNRYLRRMLWFSICLGIVVAVAAVVRIHGLERRSEEQRERTEKAEKELRLLSQQLVRAQEEERKHLSRELHDQVGQMLTALRMEIGKVERALHGGIAAPAIAECRQLIDTIMRTVRDLSMGLRPAMLDDFGLGPALSWHGRDFSRRFNVPVHVTIQGDLDRLPEPHRTCIYRIVQESLTNCARHAKATQINISVQGDREKLRLAIQDNGVGLNESGDRKDGLGLLGIEERVREMHGAIAIESTGGNGTTLQVEIPMPGNLPEAEVADFAG
jgi:signal transduction histidine kinase/outer membrane murein-binding lipoprotein Lpp